MIRRLRLDVLAAYAARFALTLVGLAMRPLPRTRKVTMLTRQSNTPSPDFMLLKQAILRADPSAEVVVIAHMVPPGILPKFGYAVHLIKEMYHASTSQLLVIDGYSIIASSVVHDPRLTIVQLWHALGALKRFGLSTVGQPGGRDPRLAKAMRMHKGYNIVVTSAERCRDPFADAFGVEPSQVVVAPLPRVDLLRSTAERERARAKFAALYPELDGERIALFAPTFRTEGPLPTAEPDEVTAALDKVGFATITKLHPLLPPPTDPRLRTAPGMSTQELLLVADVFITDYSSAVFEAAVARVPSYLFAPDLAEYSQRRDFYLRYPHDLGLPMAKDVSELATCVSEGRADAEMMERIQAEFIADLPTGSDSAAADHLASVLASLPTQGRDASRPER